MLNTQGPKYQYGTGCLSDGVLGDGERVAKDDPRVEAGWSFLATRVYPDENVEVTRERDSHGVETISVKVSPASVTSPRISSGMRSSLGEMRRKVTLRLSSRRVKE